MLQELTQPCKRVKACETQQLLEAVEAIGKTNGGDHGLEVGMRESSHQAHSALKWDDRLAKLSGQEGFVVQHDKALSIRPFFPTCLCMSGWQEDATLQVRFPSVSLTAWLPESTLTYLEDSQPTTEAVSSSVAWHRTD